MNLDCPYAPVRRASRISSHGQPSFLIWSSVASSSLVLERAFSEAATMLDVS
jgi:hypothetical protein